MYSLILLSLATISAETKPRTIEGTVTDPNGRPVAAASVILADTLALIGVRPEVYGRCQSDGQGHFSIPAPAVTEDIYGARHYLAVWAYKAGLAVGLHILPSQWPRDGAEVSIPLGPLASLTFQVQGSDSRALSGATLTFAHTFGWPVPDPLAELLQARTDAEGKARLAGFQASDIDVLRVNAPGFGTQQVAKFQSTTGLYPLRLSAAGRLEGRVTASDPKAVLGLRLHVRTWTDPSDAPRVAWLHPGEIRGLGGLAEVITSDDGSFTVPAVAEGTLQIKFVPHMDLPYRGSFEQLVTVEPGQTTKVEIPLKKAVRIRGQVLEQGTGKPIPDALVRVDWSQEIPRARTDAAGWYQAYLLSGSVTLHVPAPPAPYYYAQQVLPSQPVPPASEEVTLKPFRLARGVYLQGRVVDEHEKPAASAAVWAEWPLPAGGSNIARAWTDRHGNFELPGVDPKADLRLFAEVKDAIVLKPHVVRADEKKPVALHLASGATFSLAGQVVDTRGRPVTRIPVRIISGYRESERNFFLSEGAVLFGNRREVLTDDQGRYSTPRWLRPDRQYQAEVEAPGLINARTRLLDPAITSERTFPDLVLSAAPRPINVSGRVIDRQGHPVARAQVFQSGSGPRRTRTNTDGHGNFCLPGVYQGTAFLFVERDGFRFRGFAIDAGDKPVELVVDRIDEPVRTALKTLPPVLPREQEPALLQQLLAPLVKELKPEISARMYRLFELVARGDPSRALAMAEQAAIRDDDIKEILRFTVAEGLMEQSPDEALAVAETFKDPAYRALLYVKASDSCSRDERERKLSLIHTAIVQARSSSRSTSKLDAFGQAAIRLLDLGEHEEAIRILREGQTYAQGLAKPSDANRRSDDVHARGRFAAKLARIDAKAALELASGFTDPTYHDWYIGGVALGLSEQDPAEAERVLAMVHGGYQREDKTIRICGRMAARDLKRARALAEKLETPLQRLSALSAIARALAESDPPAATKFLQEILTGYQKLLHEGRDQGQSSIGGVGVQVAALLPVAEELGPEFLESCFWRAVSLCPPRPSRGDPDDWYERGISQVALLLARYDREVARAVLNPAVLRLRSLIFSDREYTAQPVLAGATAIDPAWAVRIVDAIPDDLPGDTARPKEAARRTIASILTYGVKERWQHLQTSYAYQREDSRDDER
jgi:protocatechuate 3,4-dioxygenase beta subunit